MPSETLVYISTNQDREFHVGLTKDLEVEVALLSDPEGKGRASRRGIDTLVYVERAGSIKEAMRRVDQIRKMRRSRKERLIGSVNPKWRDLMPWLPHLLSSDLSGRSHWRDDEPPAPGGVLVLLPIGPPPTGYKYEQPWPPGEG